MEQIFYGEDRIVQIMENGHKDWLFYVNHCTKELYDQYVEYCEDEHFDPKEEKSAIAFIEYRDHVFEESLQHDMDFND